VTRIVKGFPRGSWEKEPGRRNEALDALEHMQAHLDRDLPVTALAAVAQISPFYFSRMFKQSTGLSPHNICCASGSSAQGSFWLIPGGGSRRWATDSAFRTRAISPPSSARW
jgi:AraC-like DNA-binding protein